VSDNDPSVIERAQELFVARSIAAETIPRPLKLAFVDLYRFLTDPAATLSPLQQRALFTEPRIRQDYRSLKNALRWRRPDKQIPMDVQIPGVVAAAGDRDLDDRTFEVPVTDAAPIQISIRIRPAGIGRQFTIEIRFSDALDPPRAMQIENEHLNQVAKTALPAPDIEGRILIIKNMANENDAQFLRLLRKPTTTGTFLK